MYWLTSTAFSISNALLLKVPSVRRGLGLGDPRRRKDTDQGPKNDFAAFSSWSESKCGRGGERERERERESRPAVTNEVV